MSVDFPARLELRELPWMSRPAADLRKQMDAEVVPRYADLRAQAQGPPVDPADVLFCLIAYDGAVPAATIALQRTGGYFEIKRVFVAPSHRRQGLAGTLLAAAEKRAAAGGIRELVLQTGVRQPEAMALYVRHGWRAIPPFGPYREDLVISRCFSKSLPTESATATGDSDDQEDGATVIG